MRTLKLPFVALAATFLVTPAAAQTRAPLTGDYHRTLRAPGNPHGGPRGGYPRHGNPVSWLFELMALPTAMAYPGIGVESARHHPGAHHHASPRKGAKARAKMHRVARHAARPKVAARIEHAAVEPPPAATLKTEDVPVTPTAAREPSTIPPVRIEHAPPVAPTAQAGEAPVAPPSSGQPADAGLACRAALLRRELDGQGKFLASVWGVARTDPLTLQVWGSDGAQINLYYIRIPARASAARVGPATLDALADEWKMLARNSLGFVSPAEGGPYRPVKESSPEAQDIKLEIYTDGDSPCAAPRETLYLGKGLVAPILTVGDDGKGNRRDLPEGFGVHGPEGGAPPGGR
jgi:hypothetical protein